MFARGTKGPHRIIIAAAHLTRELNPTLTGQTVAAIYVEPDHWKPQTTGADKPLLQSCDPDVPLKVEQCR